ncbi:hypothetical protein GCM10007385_32400 [Tateyamaria omphalii]|uniref:hypothetical protein n=1 Tax=Tateyamaria omphalii TaxID=299262 RepID=UPI001673D117|nr:hypothetical protein [Tateyamaria omphalii]GGX60651.1 hypothetical protein GCM10007385_32400 [Tateyamaria omphalii]
MKYTLIPGQPHTASEEETMSMIRSVLTDDAETLKPHRRKAKVADMDTAGDPQESLRAFTERTPPPAPRRRADDLPELEKDTYVQKRPDRFHELANTIMRVRRFEPKTRHLALACAALLFVVRPHWFVIAAVIVFALVVAIFLTFGADRIWTAVLGWLDRVEMKDSARAEDLRAKLDTFAYRWDSVLDLFPDGMVDGLYMPDFQSLRMAEVEHQEVVAERLSRMVQET